MNLAYMKLEMYTFSRVMFSIDGYETPAQGLRFGLG